MEDTLGDDVAGALDELVKTLIGLSGQFSAEFSLDFTAGVVAPATAWCCTVEGDLSADDGSYYTVRANTAAAALREASREVQKRILPPPR